MATVIVPVEALILNPAGVLENVPPPVVIVGVGLLAVKQ